MSRVVGVAFKENGKLYNFDAFDIELELKDNVIVETEKGMQYGKVLQISNEENVEYELKPILRIATAEDDDKYMKNIKEGNQVVKKATELAAELNLSMRFLNAVFTFDKKQLLITYVADERIDFRELVKKLAGVYHARIELHQIGARDKAKEVGGIGQCGREFCCSSFLNHIDSVSMNMAKNQNLSLNPNKINGACGRLLCCLTYEDEEYCRCQKNMPYIGQQLKRDGFEGKVSNVNILSRSYVLSNENGEKKEIFVDENRCPNK